MATILNIETATSVCSVAIGIDGECVALKEINEGRTHAEVLTVFIEDVIKQAGISYKDLDAIAVSSGPGSYTGLRIGVSTAKGLCYALEKPLISVDTLKAMAWGGIRRLDEIENNTSLMEPSLFDFDYKSVILCPMIDARRMEVYTAFYDLELGVIKTVSADIITEESYSNYLKDNKKLIFFGDGMPKVKEVLFEENTYFFNDLLPSASNIALISYCKFEFGEFEDLAYFEPFYLKDFVATKARSLLV